MAASLRSDPQVVRDYLGYLDKEMTIMGILSAAAAGALGLILKELRGPLLASAATRPLGAAGLLALGAAALLFYLQRSHMAWHYGRLALGLCERVEIDPVFESAMSWSFWLRYRTGFVAGTAAGACFAAAALSHEGVIPFSHPNLVASGLLLLAILGAALQWRVLASRDDLRT